MLVGTRLKRVLIISGASGIVNQKPDGLASSFDFVQRDFLGQCVAVHSETGRGTNQVAVMTLDQLGDKALLELGGRLGKQYASVDHLDTDGFQAIL